MEENNVVVKQNRMTVWLVKTGQGQEDAKDRMGFHKGDATRFLYHL